MQNPILQRLKNTSFLVLLLLISVSCSSNKNNKTTKNTLKKPNIVMILSDDQAWNDYGFMGHDIVETPHLDKLASQSVLFKRGYVPTPICRPSLMTLATGLYPHQHKITGNDPKGGYRKPVYPREELLQNIDTLPSLSKILKTQGYVTHQSGKWWEGDFKRGGFTHGMTKGERHGDEGLTIGRKGMSPIFNFIYKATSEDKPFYVWYAPFLPHRPHNPPDSLFQKYADKTSSDHLARYYAMIEWFDQTCGELINYLDDNGLRGNTLIYYVCDNGWIQQENSPNFDIGSKQTPMEAGVRTPIMFSWPGKLNPSERNELISSIDLLPTILGAANIEQPRHLPGLNLWNQLTQEKPLTETLSLERPTDMTLLTKTILRHPLAIYGVLKMNGN